jgi:hypothetical protein
MSHISGNDYFQQTNFKPSDNYNSLYYLAIVEVTGQNKRGQLCPLLVEIELFYQLS